MQPLVWILVLLQVQHLTILSIELHVKTRRDLCPDPGFDPICAIFYHVTCDTDDTKETGIFLVDSECSTENYLTAMTSAASSSLQTQNENIAENGKGMMLRLFHKNHSSSYLTQPVLLQLKLILTVIISFYILKWICSHHSVKSFSI